MDKKEFVLELTYVFTTYGLDEKNAYDLAQKVDIHIDKEVIKRLREYRKQYCEMAKEVIMEALQPYLPYIAQAKFDMQKKKEEGEK